MSKSLPLLNGSNITLSEALDHDDDVLQQISYPEKRIEFYVYLVTHKDEIKAIVSHHLGVCQDTCRVGEVKEWIHGSFNVCIPVYVNNNSWGSFRGRKVNIRFPLPYKVGEAHCPGNAEEKLRCEAATYVWIQMNAPTVPIPSLWGFGFPGGQSFTSLETTPLLSRVIWHFQYITSWMFGCHVPLRYVRSTRSNLLEVGYLLLEYVEDGKMLSETWETFRHDQNRRTNLFRDLSRLMLSLAQHPQPRIGSLTIDNHGVISLTNRPLVLQLHQLENNGIPTDIPRNLTYTSADTYFLDILACHNNRIRYQPNSILDIRDGQAQLSALTAMHSLIQHFPSRDLRYGPFVLSLTDLHQSNIFVDENWHITRIIDLEWACVRPVEMLYPPYWLTSRSIDDLDDDHLEDYSQRHKEFMDAFEIEEKLLLPQTNISLTDILWRCWRTGNFWYLHALDSPKGLYALFIQHIQPRFARLDKENMELFDRVVTPYWSPGASDVIATKIKERELYSGRLQRAFEVLQNFQIRPNSFNTPISQRTHSQVGSNIMNIAKLQLRESKTPEKRPTTSDVPSDNEDSILISEYDESLQNSKT